MIFKKNEWFVYMIECGDGSLYTGIAKDVSKRLKEHESGKGSKYLRGKYPLKLVYTKSVQSHSEALKQELKIKRLTKEQKWDLISGSAPKPFS